MNIMNPEIHIEETGWLKALFGYKFKVWMTFATEVIRRDMRTSEDHVYGYRNCQTFAEAYAWSQILRNKVTGHCEEHYCQLKEK